MFDLDQFAEQQHQQTLQTSERFLSELLWPKLTHDSGGRTRRILLAEAHNRLSAPLYCLSFALIALAVVTRGRRARGVYALRLIIASVAAGALRLLGYGAQGFVVRHPSSYALLYLVPLIGCAFAALEINGIDLFAFMPGFRRSALEPAR